MLACHQRGFSNSQSAITLSTAALRSHGFGDCHQKGRLKNSRAEQEFHGFSGRRLTLALARALRGKAEGLPHSGPCETRASSARDPREGQLLPSLHLPAGFHPSSPWALKPTEAHSAQKRGQPWQQVLLTVGKIHQAVSMPRNCRSHPDSQLPFIKSDKGYWKEARWH